MKLPIELIEEISFYFTFVKIFELFPKLARYVFDKEKHTWKWAASNGYLEIIKWLYYNDKCYPEYVRGLALQNGHLEILKWLEFKVVLVFIPRYGYNPYMDPGMDGHDLYL